MTDKQKILAEIENLKKHYLDREEYDFDYNKALEHIASFINSLPEEPVMEDLEEAALEYCNKGWKEKEPLEAFKAGAQWQKSTLLQWSQQKLAEYTKLLLTKDAPVHWEQHYAFQQIIDKLNSL